MPSFSLKAATIGAIFSGSAIRSGSTIRHETELDAGGVAPVEVECVCSLVRTVLRENMLSAFRADAPGLEAFVTCPSESS